MWETLTLVSERCNSSYQKRERKEIKRVASDDDTESGDKSSLCQEYVDSNSVMSSDGGGSSSGLVIAVMVSLRRRT